jgi:hypothetical protein
LIDSAVFPGVSNAPGTNLLLSSSLVGLMPVDSWLVDYIGGEAEIDTYPRTPNRVRCVR